MGDACHCTTLGDTNVIAGDWVGYANDAIESDFPGAMSITTIGCGADVGPQPSGTDEISHEHGVTIAREAKRLVNDTAHLRPLSGELTTTNRNIQLPLLTPPEKRHWETELNSRDPFHRELAKQMLQELEQRGGLPTYVPLPITVWKWNNELAMVFLAGEVCVDYAVRLKTQRDWQRLWIHGWSNGVPCYIPSRRVLAEGGYEADFSMVYYGNPNRFAPEVEEILISNVLDMVGDGFEPDRSIPFPLGRRPE